MKKYYILISLVLVTLFSAVNAQVNYSFSATTATYAPVTGGITPALINRPYNYGQTSFTYDEGIANGIPIGFTFNYNGVDYTTINICANGFATLGTPFNTDVNTVENFYINSLALGPLQLIDNSCTDTIKEFSGNTKPLLAPLWDDLTLQADANLRYITNGVAGSRVFTFEWSGAYWQYDATSPVISFELKLYEGTNIVEFCYKDEGGRPSPLASASIGITSSEQIGGGFMSLENTSASPTISTSIEANTLNNKPANNQVYRFTPLPCALPLNVHCNSSDNISVSFAWGATSGVTNFEYAVTTSPDAPASGISTTSTSASVSSLNPGTKYFIHVRSYCSASSQSAWSAIPFYTSKNTSTPPAIEWQKSFGGSGGDGASSVRQTSDGGFIIAGSSLSNDGDVTGNHGNTDYWIVKLNSNQTIQWQRSFGGSGDDWAFSIIQTSDGGYIVAGITTSNDGDVTGNHGGYGDYWIIKLNSSGALQWQKCLGGSDIDWGLSVDTADDGGYIVAGFTYSNDGDVTGKHLYFADYWVVKLSSSGSIQWQKCLGGTDEDRAYTVNHTADGGYIVAGHSSSNDGDVTGNHASNDYWIVKLSGSGVIEWQKSLGGSNSESSDGSSFGEGNHIDQTSDGGYIVAGSTNSNDGDVSGHYGLICKNDLWVVKLTGAGNIEWEKYLGGVNYDEAYSVKQTPDGGFIIAGISNSNDIDITNNHGNTDYWIVKLNNLGNLQWQKSLGGSDDDKAISIQVTNDNGYIIAGSSISNDGDVTGNHGASDSWLVKLGPDILLPVTLLNFSGEALGKQNLLHWTTTSEHNNTGFELQRSIDGTQFDKIGLINSKATNGNSGLNLNYDFADINFPPGISYYRLKQIDKDGKFSYSNIVVLKHNIIAGTISVYPNPVNNILNVAVASTGNNKITFSIADISGRVLQSTSTHRSNGPVIIQVDVSTLTAGIYFLKILSDDGKKNMVRKFVKE